MQEEVSGKQNVRVACLSKGQAGKYEFSFSSPGQLTDFSYM